MVLCAARMHLSGLAFPSLGYAQCGGHISTATCSNADLERSEGRVSTADKSLPCVCHRLQLLANAVTQRELSSRVEFDFNNLII